MGNNIVALTGVAAAQPKTSTKVRLRPKCLVLKEKSVPLPLDTHGLETRLVNANALVKSWMVRLLGFGLAWLL